MLFASSDYVLRSSQLARCGATNLKVELAYSFSIEHSVERCDLVDIHLIDFCDFGDLPHSGEGQKVIVLFLCESEERDDG